MRQYKLWDGVICLCLDKRKEEWLRLKREAFELGIDLKCFIAGSGKDKTLNYDYIDDQNDHPEWVGAVAGHEINHYNAFRCHQGLAKMAKRFGYRSALFLEDDAYFTAKFLDVIDKLENDDSVVDYIHSHPITYLGWWCQGNDTDDYCLELEEAYKERGEVIIRSIPYGVDLGGTHGVIFRADMYDVILSLPANISLDSQLCFLRHYYPSVKICPKIVHVKTMYSHTEGVVIDRKII